MLYAKAWEKAVCQGSQRKDEAGACSLGCRGRGEVDRRESEVLVTVEVKWRGVQTSRKSTTGSVC